MKNCLLIKICLYCIFSFSGYSQNQCNTVNFIILIDDEISGLNISDGKFIIKDSLNVKLEEIPFTYHVGKLSFSEESLLKFNSVDATSHVEIAFKNTVFRPEYEEKEYTFSFYASFINKEYMLLKIYNLNKVNRKKYWFGDRKYLCQFKIPSISTLLPFRKK